MFSHMRKRLSCLLLRMQWPCFWLQAAGSFVVQQPSLIIVSVLALALMFFPRIIFNMKIVLVRLGLCRPLDEIRFGLGADLTSGHNVDN